MQRPSESNSWMEAGAASEDLAGMIEEMLARRGSSITKVELA